MSACQFTCYVEEEGIWGNSIAHESQARDYFWKWAYKHKYTHINTCTLSFRHTHTQWVSHTLTRGRTYARMHAHAHIYFNYALYVQRCYDVNICNSVVISREGEKKRDFGIKSLISLACFCIITQGFHLCLRWKVGLHVHRETSIFVVSLTWLYLHFIYRNVMCI